jgi:toxin ParE1/3/4
MPAPRRRLTLTPRAREDIRQSLLYSRQQWGEEQRRRYRRRLDDAMVRLVDFPESGQPRDDLYPGCRQLRVEQHILFYRVTNEEVVVGRLLHVRQDAIDHVTP